MEDEPVWERLDDRTIRLTLRDWAEGKVSWRHVLRLWAEDGDFCLQFGNWLAEAPFEAFAWETPPLTAATLDEPFECVIVDSPMLARHEADSGPFADHLRNLGERTTATFRSLGGDADLIAPSEHLWTAEYGHLAAFLRTAPDAQKAELWWAVSGSVQTWLKTDKLLWLSTAGLGVAWLHVRLDSRPKYYRHGPYRDARPVV